MKTGVGSEAAARLLESARDMSRSAFSVDLSSDPDRALEMADAADRKVVMDHFRSLNPDLARTFEGGMFRPVSEPPEGIRIAAFTGREGFREEGLSPEKRYGAYGVPPNFDPKADPSPESNLDAEQQWRRGDPVLLGNLPLVVADRLIAGGRPHSDAHLSVVHVGPNGDLVRENLKEMVSRLREGRELEARGPRGPSMN